ncbi:MAG: hypothetical protein CK426_03680 [Legionella sp.]|nr:MAG: hypothetical protein CK423_05760 [Legionella sp.]PJD99116.1 MAG: hypothetical protein CK426_03680 [Legionella sp.]
MIKYTEINQPGEIEMQEEHLKGRSKKRKLTDETDCDCLSQKKTKLQTDISTLELETLSTLPNAEEHQDGISPVSVIDHIVTETDKKPTPNHLSYGLHQHSIFTPLAIQNDLSEAKPFDFKPDEDEDFEIDAEIDSLISSFKEIDVTTPSLREQMVNHCERFFESHLLAEAEADLLEASEKSVARG